MCGENALLFLLFYLSAVVCMCMDLFANTNDKPRQARHKLLDFLPPNDQNGMAGLEVRENSGPNATPPRLGSYPSTGIWGMNQGLSATFGRGMGGSIVSVAAVWDGILGRSLSALPGRLWLVA